jgi:hypothetical protein
VRLTREGLDALVDQVYSALRDVDPDHVVAFAGELDGERKPDLAEGDDGDLQKILQFVVG